MNLKRILATGSLAFVSLTGAAQAQPLTAPSEAAGSSRPASVRVTNHIPASPLPAEAAVQPAPVECWEVVPARPSGVVAGASLYVLRPHFDRNPALVVTTGVGTALTRVVTPDIDWDYQLTPAFWLGWTGESGLGVRGRYFYFEHTSEPQSATLGLGAAGTTTITPPAGVSPVVGLPPRGLSSPGVLLQAGVGQDALRVGSGLRLRATDLEATYSYQGEYGLMVFGGGARHLQISQDYRADLVNIAGPASERSSLAAGHNFEGGGPTVSWLGAWSVRDSGLALYSNLRGSLLVGSSRSDAAFGEVIVDPVLGNQNNLATNQRQSRTTLPVAEIELGLEYGTDFRRSRAFFRAAVVNQTYFNAGSATSEDGNLSLFGAQVSVGLNY